MDDWNCLHLLVEQNSLQLKVWILEWPGVHVARAHGMDLLCVFVHKYAVGATECCEGSLKCHHDWFSCRPQIQLVHLSFTAPRLPGLYLQNQPRVICTDKNSDVSCERFVHPSVEITRTRSSSGAARDKNSRAERCKHLPDVILMF